MVEKNNKEVEIVERKEPSRLIALAIEKGGVDLDKLEKLLNLQERYDANEARKAYHIAMADFKANAPALKKNKKVGYQTDKGRVGYAYASLDNLVKSIGAELSKYGLSHSWKTQQNDQIVVTCKITHVKGHSEEVTLSAPADTTGAKNNIQAIGSTVAYLERYTLLAATGLAASDMDDDGAGVTEIIDANQVLDIRTLITDTKVSEQKFCKHFGIFKLEDLPKSRVKEAVALLEARKQAKK